jgi:GTP cyclohydrolase I
MHAKHQGKYFLGLKKVNRLLSLYSRSFQSQWRIKTAMQIKIQNESDNLVLKKKRICTI